MSLLLTATRWRDDRFDLQALSPDGVTPRDLTNCSVFFGVKLTADSDPLIVAGPGAGTILTDAVHGRFAILLPPIAKIGLSSITTYFWDVVIVDPVGTSTTPANLSGMLAVQDGITPIAFIVKSVPPANVEYHAEITALDGGGAAALDGYDTSRLSLPFVFVIYIAGTGQRQEWQARVRGPGEQPDDPNVVPVADRQKVLPRNSDPVTNNVMWERKN